MLPKSRKDVLSINNWRPISLLNVDYKIAAKCIANRVKKVITSIISEEQTGFIKGRYIGENVRLISEVIENTNTTDEPGLIFFTDFNNKALDSLDHSINFSDAIIRWMQLLYNNANASVTNNEYMSEFFNINKGVRQGCPLSPYLFIVCIEILSIMIETNKNIKGIKINNVDDDGSFPLQGTKRSFENLITTLEQFGKLSGLKLSMSECTVLRIGSLRKHNVTFCPEKNIHWT